MAGKVTERKREKGVSIGCGRKFAKDEKPELIEKQNLEEVLSRPVESLEFPGIPDNLRNRIINALLYQDPPSVQAFRRQQPAIQTIGELTKCTRNDILCRKNTGRKSVSAIEAELSRIGLGLAPPKNKHPQKFIRLREDGKLETDLSREQLRVLFHLSRLEINELLETIRPEKLKVISELLGLISMSDYGMLNDEEFSRLVDKTMKEKKLKVEAQLARTEPEIYDELLRRRVAHGIIS